MSYTLTQEKLLKANKLLLRDLHATLGIDKKTLSSSQLLQKMSQALFSKPYEEVKETLLKETNDESLIPKVFVLRYGSDYIISLKGSFYTATFNGSDMQRSISSIYDEAERLSNEHNTTVKEVILPKILRDDWEYEEVVDLAKKMGYFKYTKTIFDFFGDDSGILIDGERTDYNLTGDWENEVDQLAEDDDRENYPIWYAEVNNIYVYKNKKLEYFFSFKNLCDAELKDGNWIIEQLNSREYHKINFLKK